jgi:RimJ/RimL family protein N-acetyltransferase
VAAVDGIVVETERLIVRKWRDSDAGEVAAIYAKPEVMQYIPRGVWSAEQTQRIVARMRELDEEQGFGFYPIVLKSSGTIAGHCGLGYLEKSGEVENAYVLDSPYWGQGYASEAVNAVLARAFSSTALTRIVAVAMPENARSIAVMKRVRMTELGPARHFGMTVVKYERRKAVAEAQRDAQ